MAKDTKAKDTKAKDTNDGKLGKAPGEVRNNLQVVVRVLVALIIVVVVGGFLWALFLRPERVIENSQDRSPLETVLEV